MAKDGGENKTTCLHYRDSPGQAITAEVAHVRQVTVLILLSPRSRRKELSGVPASVAVVSDLSHGSLSASQAPAWAGLCSHIMTGRATYTALYDIAIFS